MAELHTLRANRDKMTQLLEQEHTAAEEVIKPSFTPFSVLS